MRAFPFRSVLFDDAFRNQFSDVSPEGCVWDSLVTRVLKTSPEGFAVRSGGLSDNVQKVALPV